MKSGKEKNILEIRDLTVVFPMDEERVMAVRDLSFAIETGKTLGLVGESGCGKSVAAFSILRLTPRPGIIESGEIRYRGRDLLVLDMEEMRKIRGREIAMIFQEPMTSLNPVMTIGSQISESLTLHLSFSKKDARLRTEELLEKVGIPSPSKRYSSYPHEFSGGMRQRVMIAMALAAEPSILIADEPTTALDVTIQAQILDLLMKIQEERRMTLLLITHDMGIVANIADDIAIMYAGEIVEYGKTRDIFKKPGHPYTRGLFSAIPKIGSKGARLATIPGTVPSLLSRPTGCVFHPRCPVALKKCLEGPVGMTVKKSGHEARCIRY
jgi:peptide/nickel transport system ATP-binding protein